MKSKKRILTYSISCLQVLDDGRLTDNKGRTVNFKNTIIIMTSNLASAYIQSQFEKITEANRNQVVEETKNEVMNMLKKTIRPESVNRIDETIMFLPLNKTEIRTNRTFCRLTASSICWKKTA